MSSPPRVDFPTSDIDDIEMDEPQDGTIDQSLSIAPPPQRLFLPGTPSAAGTPARQRYANSVAATPMSSIAARRALGMSTPRRAPRTPLFARDRKLPSRIPKLSPAKTPRRRVAIDSDPAFPDSEPLAFPSSPAAALATPVKNRRGDIHSSLSLTPTARRSRRGDYNNDLNDNLNSDGTHLSIPASSVPHLSAPAAPSDEPDEIRAIWGTTVNLAETMKLFRDFVRGFKPKYRAIHDRQENLRTRAFATPDEGEVVLYETYMRRIRQTGETNLNLDMINLLSYPPCKKLFAQLQKYPQEVGDQGDEEIADIMGKVYKVRPFGLTAVNMRELNPSDTDKLISIKGLVIRATPVIPDMKIEEPARCPRDVCGSVGTMSLVHNRCEFADRQVIRLQETPDAVPDGQTPHTVSLSVYDELVDVCKPGDRVVVTGIYRSVPVRVNPRQRTMKSLFKTYLDVVHVRLSMGGSLGLDRSTTSCRWRQVPGIGGVGDSADDQELEEQIAQGGLTRKAKLEAKLINLSRRHDLYDLLARSLAPSIWEMDDVKKGILLHFLVAPTKASQEVVAEADRATVGTINVLLVGDPGT
ncbi:hypothetical protein BD769DRAFT_1545818, partial [Suillus cothurnatus]